MRDFKINGLTAAKWKFKICADKILRQYNAGEYKFDDNNTEAITEICKYFALDPTFQGDLTKGILLVGNVGTGKTLICEIIKAMFAECITNLGNGKIMEIYDATSIADAYADDSAACKDIRYKLHNYGIICIDDIGTEKAVVKSYGTEKLPLQDVLASRYRNRKLTFATSNLSPSEIKDKYDERIGDRCKQMFNVIVLDGKSRRR